MQTFKLPSVWNAGRAYPRDKPPLREDDLRIMLLFSLPEFSRRAHNTLPIRGIGDDGVVDVYRDGDEVAYMPGGKMSPHKIAAYLGVFSVLGWADAFAPEFSMQLVYHSFMAAFDFDSASDYATLSSRDVREPFARAIDARQRHYVRSGYRVFRVRLADSSSYNPAYTPRPKGFYPNEEETSTIGWVDCSIEEAYRRGAMAASSVLSAPALRPGVYVVPRPDQFGELDYVLPTPPNVPALGVQEGRTLERRLQAATEATAAQMNSRTRSPTLRIPTQGVDKISAKFERLALSDSLLPSGTKAAGESIRAAGDASYYADNWEALMRDYDADQYAEQRKAHIHKDLMRKGLTPKSKIPPRVRAEYSGFD